MRVEETPPSHPSRDRMVEATIDLLRGSGLEGAGINAIVKASGSPRGSVYHFFPGGKAQIVAEALTVYAARKRAGFAASLERGRTPGEKVRSLFDTFAADVDRRYARSCAVACVAHDLGDDTAAFKPLVDAAFRTWADEVAVHLPNPGSARTRSFARLVVATLQGALVQARTGASVAPLTEAGQWLGALADHALAGEAA